MNKPQSNDTAERAQLFFDALAIEKRKPHVSEHFKTFVSALLNRATEAGLYSPGENA